MLLSDNGSSKSSIQAIDRPTNQPSVTSNEFQTNSVRRKNLMGTRRMAMATLIMMMMMLSFVDEFITFLKL